MAVLPLFKVALALAGVLVVLPRILFDRPRVASGAIDRFVIDLIRMVALSIVAVHVLVPLRLFQWTGVLLAGVAWVYLARLRPAGWTLERMFAEGERLSTAVLLVVEAHSRDGNLVVRRIVREWYHTQVAPRIRLRRPGPELRAALLMSLPLFGVLAGSLAIRLAYPLTHAALVPSDGYVHLAWLKYLSAGRLFHDGLYPQGMHAVLGLVEKLSPATNAEVVRFAGPILNTLTVFLVYVAGVRATGNPGAGLVAAASIGLVGTTLEGGLEDFRQVGTLPQEFAVLIAFGAVLMALEYVARPTRSRLLYLGVAAFVVSMVHPVAVGVVAVAAGCCAIAAAARARRIVPALRVLAATTIGVAAGGVWLVAGLASGLRFYGAIVNLNPVGRYGDEPGVTTYLPPIGDLAFGYLSLAGAAVGVVWGIVQVRRGRRRGALAAMLGALVLVCGAVQITGDSVLYKWYAARWVGVATPFLSLGLALGMAPLGWLLTRARTAVVRPLAGVGSGLAVTAAMVVALPPHLAAPRGSQVEYEQAARSVQDDISANPRLTFTIVGTPATYTRALGSAWHVQISDFTRRLTIDQAADPAFQLPVPTRKVYVLTESRPFPTLSRGRNADYDDPVARDRLMGRAEEWMQTYARYHHDARIAFEEGPVRVWLVEHRISAAYARRYGLAGTSA